MDSSRYFVIRLQTSEQGGGVRHAFVGLGFDERSDAFDFNCALSDHERDQEKEKSARQAMMDTATTSSLIDGEHIESISVPAKDYSLKEGQSITVKFGGAASNSDTAKNSNSNTHGSGTAPLIKLAPPPATNVNTDATS